MSDETPIAASGRMINSLAEFHRALAEGRLGIRRLPEEITQGSGVQVGATVDWNPVPMFTEAEAANIDRVSQFAIAAATQALGASGLDLKSVASTRTATGGRAPSPW